MIRLITDGPGWTDDMTFYSHDGKCVGFSSNEGVLYEFEEPLEESLETLRDLLEEEFWDEDDGIHRYFEHEGENLEEFKPEEEIQEEDIESYSSVKKFLKDLGIFEGSSVPTTSAFKLRVVTTFTKDIEIAAENEEEAIKLAYEFIGDGDIDGTDTDDFETEVTVIS